MQEGLVDRFVSIPSYFTLLPHPASVKCHQIYWIQSQVGTQTILEEPIYSDTMTTTQKNTHALLL
jgi:hypothetical protein